MNNFEKIKCLKKLINKSSSIKQETYNDPDFKSWKNLVERTLVKVFGDNSTEYKHFSKLKFFANAAIYMEQHEANAAHLESFRSSFKILTDSINEYISEFSEEVEEPKSLQVENNKSNIAKVFISHSSDDAAVVEEVVEILETIGLDSHQIFCSSFEGYGIDLGENFLEAIKSELSFDSLVLFILSKNFYQSPICMCEMGASWVLSKKHIPILIPPLNYDDVKGVIPLTQGFKINESLKLNSFKDKIETTFKLERILKFSTWERKRDRICSRIEKLIK